MSYSTFGLFDLQLVLALAFRSFFICRRVAMGRPFAPIKHFGSIEHDVRNRTWRVKIELNRKTHTGPRRFSKAEAKSDQAKGRRTASRKAFAVVLRQLTRLQGGVLKGGRWPLGNQTPRSSASQLASLKPKKMSSKPDKAQTRFRKISKAGRPRLSQVQHRSLVTVIARN